jgi:hypothetical protein
MRYRADLRYYLPANTHVDGLNVALTPVISPAIGVATNVSVTFVADRTYLLINLTDGGATSFLGSGAGDDLLYIKNVTLTKLGATLALEPEGIQPAPGQWLDSSSNHLDALMPVVGASNTRAIRDGWMSFTTGATSQYIHGGTTRAILPPANAWIDEIYAYSTGTPTFTLGDSSTGGSTDTLTDAVTLTASTWTKLVLKKNSTTADDIYVAFTADGAATQFKVRYHKINL